MENNESFDDRAISPGEHQAQGLSRRRAQRLAEIYVGARCKACRLPIGPLEIDADWARRTLEVVHEGCAKFLRQERHVRAHLQRFGRK